MAYITASDLRAVVPDPYRDAALADGGEGPEPGLLSAVLEAASNEVDALVEGRIRLPVSTPPKKFKTAATYIALGILFARRGLELPASTAKSIDFYRTWLSRVGAGELRAEAAEEPTPSSTARPGAISSRPSVTGSGRLIGCLALVLSSLVWPQARAIEPRTFSFQIRSTNLIENADYMEWSQAESVQLDYELVAPNVDDGRDVRWEVTDPSNLWINASPDHRLNGTWSWELSPTQSCLPAGIYSGRVAVYERTGTNLTFHRAVALQELRVAPAADPLTLVMASPLGALTAYFFDTSVAALSNSLTARIGLEETNRAYAVGAVQTNLTAASNLASLANARAIAAHAAVSNLPPVPTNTIDARTATNISAAAVSNWSIYPAKTTIEVGTNHAFKNDSGISYFVNSTNSGDLLFSSSTGNELDMNDGDIDNISDIQVATISPRPGGEVPRFPSGIQLGGVTRTIWPGDASRWSEHSATQTVSLGANALHDVSEIIVQDDIFAGGNIEMEGGQITGVGDLSVTNITLGGVTRTTWPEGGSSTGSTLYYAVTSDSSAVGNQALARTNGAAFGTAAWADSYGAAIGDTAYAPNSGAALGSDTLATDYGVAVGRGAQAQHTNVAVGAGAQATGHNSVSIGAGAVNESDNTVLLGNAATTQTVARGTLAVDSIALGTNPPISIWPQGGSTSAGGITNLVVNGYSIPQTNGQAYLSITTSGGIFASNTPGSVELFLSSFPSWAGVGSNRLSINYQTNAPQYFTVPSGVTNMAFWVWGAGTYNGPGGSSFNTAPVTPGETLEIRVGGRGASQTKTNDWVFGGWPGGGDGWSKGAALTQSGAGYSGIFRGTNIIVIAAGGGSGASGGGLTGGTGAGTPGVGGSQTSGGSPASTNQLAGAYLQGGSATTNATGVGGGAGFFGGGGGIATGASGGGSGRINTEIGAVGYTFRGLIGTEFNEYISGRGGALQDGLITIGY